MPAKWNTEATEAKAKEMITLWEPHCSTPMETVLAHHLAWLTASHLQLQEAYAINSAGVIRANSQADLTQQSAKIAVSGLSERLERLEE